MPAALEVSGRVLRTALGRYTTGVTLVTTLDATRQPVGLTVNSFASLSLDPPLVLWSLRKASSLITVFDAARHFAVNVLAREQIELSRRFASSAVPVAEKFAIGNWAAGNTGLPVLADAAACFECRLEARHDGGDHVLYVGRVLHLSEHAVEPLVFQGGHYHRLGERL